MSVDSNAVLGSDLTSAFDIQGALDKLNDNPTKYLYNRAQVFPSLVVPNFGVGFYGKYELSANITDSTNYNVDYVNDIAFVVGYNFRLFDGKVKIGFNTRITNRTEYHATVPTTTTGLDLSTNGKEGIGVGSDVGLILTGPWKYLPTLAAVMRDAGHTKYDFQEGMFNSTNDTPDEVRQTLDVGIGLFPIVGKGVRSSWAIEVRDVLNLSDYEDQTKLYHFGFEFNFYDGFFLRGGLNQSYWTTGLEFAVSNYQLQLATYGEEVGRGDTKLEDRRYVAKFAYRF